ncbi:hypothetical protein C8F04DRAFT_1104813 [Mycena alexandri]|uniref:Uncharacterized protein n=1 Tax=Mycena alexandri TaxID=1745969 RepID=A0AAD6SX96_9AGAR|nr:hypothetical protein C8F04DRAFT_1104813 [Mycena alexandri]
MPRPVRIPTLRPGTVRPNRVSGLPGRPPSIAHDILAQWQIPPNEYNKDLVRPVMDKLPPPATAGRPSLPQLNLNRTCVVQGLPGDTTLSSILLNIHQGALEFARIENEPPQSTFLPPTKSLTLSFLASSSAQAFVDMYLAEPVRLHAFTRSLFPSWHWLPPSPLPSSISDAISRSGARRVLSISWEDPAYMFSQDLHQFGELERFWRFNPRRLLVSFFAIADAMKAKAHIAALDSAPDPGLHVTYFPDWCELSDDARFDLMRVSRRETYLAYHPPKAPTSNVANARGGKKTTPSEPAVKDGEIAAVEQYVDDYISPPMLRFKAAMKSMDVGERQAQRTRWRAKNRARITGTHLNVVAGKRDPRWTKAPNPSQDKTLKAGKPTTIPATTVTPANPVMERFKAALDSIGMISPSPAMLLVGNGGVHARKNFLTEVADEKKDRVARNRKAGAKVATSSGVAARRDSRPKARERKTTSTERTRTRTPTVMGRVEAALDSIYHIEGEVKKARRHFRQSHRRYYEHVPAAAEPEDTNGQKPETSKPPLTMVSAPPVPSASGNATTTDG